jgi:protoporphyrin/coproporphyrin ferrochelatase
MPAQPDTAILLLAHGTPNTLGEMADYLSRVVGGRAMSAEVVAELQHRYAAIGLRDEPGEEAPPLTKWAVAQGQALEAALAKAGTPLRVYVAMRNWHPLIADVVVQMRAAGIARVLAICLAPQNSRTSTGLYRRGLMAAAEPADAKKLEVTFVDEWPEEPALIEGFARRLAEVYASACAAPGGGENRERALPVLFTAHSVPCRTIITVPSEHHGGPSQTTPDPYPVEAKRTAAMVFLKAQQLLGDAAPRQYFFAFQSQGVAGGPWIGPTVEDTLAALAKESHRGVVLQPIGFVCDHVEVLYDIDIAFAETARGLGMKLFRPESLNDSPLLTEALVNIVLKRLPR